MIFSCSPPFQIFRLWKILYHIELRNRSISGNLYSRNGKP
nr:MAG TPA: hypothetical protein [Caudoviricetes sp.]